MTENERTIVSVNWWEYVQQITDGDTNTEIASRIGVTGPSVGRWKAGGKPDPTTTATLAREYGRPVLEAFVAAGYLTATEAGEKPTGRPVLAQLDDDELLAEVASRMKGASDHGLAHNARPATDAVPAAGGNESRLPNEPGETFTKGGGVTHTRNRKRSVRGGESGDTTHSRIRDGNGAKGEPEG